MRWRREWVDIGKVDECFDGVDGVDRSRGNGHTRKDVYVTANQQHFVGSGRERG